MNPKSEAVKRVLTEAACSVRHDLCQIDASHSCDDEEEEEHEAGILDVVILYFLPQSVKCKPFCHLFILSDRHEASLDVDTWHERGKKFPMFFVPWILDDLVNEACGKEDETSDDGGESRLREEGLNYDTVAK